MKWMHMLSFILVIVGGLNWGLVGAGELSGVAGGWNVVDMLFGMGSTLSALIYLLVGLGALYLIFTHKNDCKVCSAGGMM